MVLYARNVTDLEAAVRAVLENLPPGDTYSYGWVADQAGYPGRARAVGTFLASGAADDVPWWRVVRSDGRLVAPSAREQAQRLRAEGVGVANGRVRERPNHVPCGL